jgi:hypothetical protein
MNFRSEESNIAAESGDDLLDQGIEDWWQHATLRRSPQRTLAAMDGTAARFFPERLMPWVNDAFAPSWNPDVRRRMEIHQLYAYLRFVAALESRVVNPTVLTLAWDELGIGFSSKLRRAAWQVYCDEAWHAFAALDLLHQVEVHTGVAPVVYEFESVQQRVDPTLQPVDDVLSGLGTLLRVVATETVITGWLREIPRDTAVCRPIRSVVADHARDERRHAVLFGRVFEELWARLNSSDRGLVSRALPTIVAAVLAPDHVASTDSLRAAGFDAASAADVVHRAYATIEHRALVASFAQPTVRLLAEHGALDEPGAREAWEAVELLPETGV